MVKSADLFVYVPIGLVGVVDIDLIFPMQVFQVHKSRFLLGLFYGYGYG